MKWRGLRPGEVRRKGKQPYRYLGTVEHVAADNRIVVMHRFESECADCGRKFVLKALKSAVSRGDLRRRCDVCKRPGVPVDRHRAASGRAKRRRRRTPEPRVFRLPATVRAAQKALRAVKRYAERRRLAERAEVFSLYVDRLDISAGAPRHASQENRGVPYSDKKPASGIVF